MIAHDAIRLCTFGRHCVADSRLILSERDRLHVLTGRRHDNQLFAKRKPYSLSSVTANVRGGRPLLEQSQSERIADALLCASPYVIDIRCHYPVCVATKSAPQIIDRMVVVELLERRGVPHLHALFMDAERHRKARPMLAALHVTSELFDRFAFTAVQIQNAYFCNGLVQRHDIRALRNEAWQFAGMLLESESRRRVRPSARCARRYKPCDLDGLMLRLGRRLRLGTTDWEARDAAYTRLGAALVLGYLELDDGYALEVSQPLRVRLRGRREDR
ncbi:hypothetical protein [Cupriavidus consociatus]|uniref:hypothetical protein n=1 Tax=Cupriavidus consociatus TaxID=2821357 RepID=UPI001AE33119|nr:MULTISPECIES: hypothetical protein [unclassified Cupriavidus]MBP0621201.1 hypothetical protein [Cupriavidus sp. LEh25]MDK2657872.1 hypothetical protein [Cupriavidus sp. LEh21]